MSAEIVNLNPQKTDQEIAADLKERINAKLRELCAILDEASQHRMRIEFALAPDAFGRSSVQRLDITKPLI